MCARAGAELPSMAGEAQNAFDQKNYDQKMQE